jgi:hypothetical protein
MTRIEQQGSREVMGHQIGVYEDLTTGAPLNNHGSSPQLPKNGFG